MSKVIGLDLGDKQNVAVVFDEDGTESKAVKISNTKVAMGKYFSKHAGAVVVMEAGTHSGWISRLLEGMGHDVWVGNPRRLRAIWDASDKSDERDARVLGLMYRLEPRLLHRIHHRGETAQCDLAMIKSRQILVDTPQNWSTMSALWSRAWASELAVAVRPVSTSGRCRRFPRVLRMH